MVKLVNTLDLGSSAERLVGSSPSPGIYLFLGALDSVRRMER